MREGFSQKAAVENEEAFKNMFMWLKRTYLNKKFRFVEGERSLGVWEMKIMYNNKMIMIFENESETPYAEREIYLKTVKYRFYAYDKNEISTMIIGDRNRPIREVEMIDAAKKIIPVV